MTKEQHLLIVVSEECGEIIGDYLDNKDITYESADLLASIELFENNNFSIHRIYIEKEIKKISLEEFIKNLNKLQYFISKSLRFGLEDAHPETKIMNLLEIKYLFEEIKMYINKLDINKIEELKLKKKVKILKFMFYSIEKGLIS